ncbi:glycosyltransferase [Lacticaseibacillus paracasei]|uniref:glycosyltransferase n=1 Tax=Lacticaseibacillus paracasei TaxID=1597 RepID=UPI000297D2A8|nr:glycosyltransferase [Lacticaseibacillus paracasei]AWN84380.1 glycosyl transferase [Lacticaseibacillus paracasei]EKQ20117.1 dTDP-rhamnosyl transferase RfbF [Lacticaseibacillus paracasei]MBM6413377.1 glycosyltransferase [Lacticaseibacillus paracasei]RDF89317.1 glycosyltransferase [Lacticaseibacillus paracasei]
MKNKNGAVCVLFNPNVREFMINFNHYKPFFDELVVVDNSDVFNHDLARQLALMKNVTYISLGKNKGIGYAQNLGVLHLATSIDKICFFDQDSWTSVKDLEKLFSLLSANQTYSMLALSTDGLQSKRTNIKNVDEVISSGSIVLRTVFEKLGGFDESLFIDFVDYEFCWRMRASGYRIGIVSGTQLHHQTNSQQVLKHTKSAPFRNYYVFRNAILLIKQKLVFNRSSYVVGLLLKRAVFEIVFNDNRKSRIHFIMRGIVDGVKGRCGELVG